ncbi:MAG: hypothetical protein WBM17_15285 [Anaerolineales bacterium]
MIVQLLISLILLLDVFNLVWPLLPVRRRPRVADFLPALALGFCLLEFLLDEFRFRMFPAYLLTGGIFFLTLGRFFRPPSEQPKRRRQAILTILIGFPWLLLSAAIPLALPFHPIPEATGPYAVGTIVYAWKDTSRLETYTDDPSDFRELPVGIWYPVDKPAPAAPGAVGIAPVSSAQAAYPLLVFSPGAFGPRDSNISTYQELASHGYIVAAIDHTYQTPYAGFPDGRTILISPQFMQEAQAQGRTALTSPEENARILSGWISLRLADLRFVMDRLEEIHKNSGQGPLAGRMDLQRIGWIGHSLGGTSIAEFCREDARCQAALDLDGPLAGDRLSADEAPFPKPLMLMYSGVLYSDSKYHDLIYTASDKAFQRATHPAYALVISGAGHMNFTDLPLLSPVLAAALGTGPINPDRCIRIVNTYALAFFDKHLKDEAVPLLIGPSSAYPEVTFEARGR